MFRALSKTSFFFCGCSLLLPILCLLMVFLLPMPRMSLFGLALRLLPLLVEFPLRWLAVASSYGKKKRLHFRTNAMWMKKSSLLA